MTSIGNEPVKNPSAEAESMPVRAESAGRAVAIDQHGESGLETIRLSNGVHTNNAIASSSKLVEVQSQTVSAVALGKRKWVESDVIADSSREIELSLQLDYLATQFLEQRVPPPNLHPPGFVHYDVSLRDPLNGLESTDSPTKREVKLEEGAEVKPQVKLEEVKPAEGPPPFRDAGDAVERLLPWHVWQIWDEDLDWKPLSQSAKRSAQLLPQEYSKRWADISKRFRVAREREAKHVSPIPSLLQLHQQLSHQLRAEISPLQQQLRNSRMELESIHRARRDQIDRAKRIREDAERRQREAVKRQEDSRKGSAPGSAAGTPSRPGSGTNTPGLVAAGTPGGAVKAQQPVVVNLSLAYLPQAIKIGLLALPNAPAPAIKPPATVVRTIDEQKVTLTVDLARCSQAHIAFLAKCLNIQPAVPAATSAGPSTPAAGVASPLQASPTKPSPAPKKT